MMKRPYTKIYDLLLDFQESGEIIMEVDTSQWTSDKIARDGIGRCIRKKDSKTFVLYSVGRESMF